MDLVLRIARAVFCVGQKSGRGTVSFSLRLRWHIRGNGKVM